MTPAKNILLVDDDHFLLDMYAQKFTQGGYVVEPRSSVQAALESLRRGFSADAVIFDLIMPGEDGFAFLKALNEEKLAAGARRIALTNQSDDDERKRAEDLGIDKYIIKASMIPSEVVAAVGEALKER